MTRLVHDLGLSSRFGFVDVYSIDDPDLLAFVPRPALALLLVFPVSESYEKARLEEDANLEDWDKKGDEEDPIWFKQTIRNACGMMGVLHAVANGARELIKPDTPLSRLLDRTRPLGRLDRARALEESDELEVAHKHAATQGDSAVPNAEDEVELHYVCFTKSAVDGHLYELDGRRKGPLDRGQLGEEDDVLCEKAAAVVQSFIDREKQSGRLDFSLVALTPTFD
ncbi:putative ubiquitin carboxyl-terminal hydrolase [Pyronema omphalodes]|nr:putative ubiquitin carboxyl-terminal hydrolase [Pyronema omphalodes]